MENLNAFTPVTANSVRNIINLENISSLFDGSNKLYDWFGSYVFASHFLHVLEGQSSFHIETHGISNRMTDFINQYSKGENNFKLHHFSFAEGVYLNLYMNMRGSFFKDAASNFNESENKLIQEIAQKFDEDKNYHPTLEEKKLLLNYFYDYIESGNFSFESDTCQNTGYKIKFQFKNWKLFDFYGKKEGMSYFNPEKRAFLSVEELVTIKNEERLMTFNWSIPSGNLLVTDQFRIKSWLNVIYKDRVSLESIAGRRQITEKLLKEWNLLRVFSTTSCSIFNVNGVWIAGNINDDEEHVAQWLEENKPLLTLYKDVWSVECIDEENLKTLLINSFNFSVDEAAEKIKELLSSQYQETFGLNIPAGNYHVYCADEDEVLDNTFKSDVIPKGIFDSVSFVLSEKPLDFQFVSV